MESFGRARWRAARCHSALAQRIGCERSSLWGAPCKGQSAGAARPDAHAAHVHAACAPLRTTLTNSRMGTRSNFSRRQYVSFLRLMHNPSHVDAHERSASRYRQLDVPSCLSGLAIQRVRLYQTGPRRSVDATFLCPRRSERSAETGEGLR